jgi:hypothetical protein
MLNKIKVIGKFLSIEVKEIEKLEKKELVAYFSLLVTNPTGSETVLRCVAQGEIAKNLEEEVQKEEIVEVKGYLRNEKQKKDTAKYDKPLYKTSNEEFQKNEAKDNRQIIIRVVEFTKLDMSFEEIDSQNSNQVRLMGKIIGDFQIRHDDDGNPQLLTFKILVLREEIKSPLFFCRVPKQLISEVKEKLKKGDIIIVKGFLQTKKKEEEENEEETEKKFSRVSSIICQGFVFLDNDSVKVFNPLDKLTYIGKEVEKIDFTKPKKPGT